MRHYPRGHGHQWVWQASPPAEAPRRWVGVLPHGPATPDRQTARPPAVCHRRSAPRPNARLSPAASRSRPGAAASRLRLAAARRVRPVPVPHPHPAVAERDRRRRRRGAQQHLTCARLLRLRLRLRWSNARRAALRGPGAAQATTSLTWLSRSARSSVSATCCLPPGRSSAAASRRTCAAV